MSKIKDSCYSDLGDVNWRLFPGVWVELFCYSVKSKSVVHRVYLQHVCTLWVGVCALSIPQHCHWPLCFWVGGGSEGLGRMGLSERADGCAVAPWSFLWLWCDPIHPETHGETEQERSAPPRYVRLELNMLPISTHTLWNTPYFQYLSSCARNSGFKSNTWPIFTLFTNINTSNATDVTVARCNS